MVLTQLMIFMLVLILPQLFKLQFLGFGTVIEKSIKTYYFIKDISLAQNLGFRLILANAKLLLS
jgi:hypothetical protein